MRDLVQHGILQQSLVVRIRGRLDIRLTGALASALTSRVDRLADCVFDLADVEEIFDSGLALLLMARRCVNRAGATLRVVNCRPDILSRCRSLGIATEPTGGFNAPTNAHQIIELQGCLPTT